MCTIADCWSARRTGAMRFWLCTLTLLAADVAPDAGREVAADDIRIGISAALSGPTKSLGQNIRQGIEARFERINQNGGLDGRQLELIALDDGYEPDVTRKKMEELIDKHEVVAVMGNVGTPTAVEAVKIANGKQTLLFGAMTGASLLRKAPPDRYVVNYRASYGEETAAMVQGLLKAGVRPFEIAFFSQDDSYGEAGIKGAIDALEQAGFPYGRKLTHGRYKRNTTDVHDAVLEILDAEIPPRAIIMVGAYAPSAKFIRILRRVLPDTLFLNVSFVGSEALAEALGDQGEGVIVTQVVPAYDSQILLCQEYLSDLQKLKEKKFPDASPSFVSFEGYVVATILTEAIRRESGPLTRETIIDRIEQLGAFDIGLGQTLNISSTSHQCSHSVWPTILRGNRFEPLEWMDLQRAAAPEKPDSATPSNDDQE